MENSIGRKRVYTFKEFDNKYFLREISIIIFVGKLEICILSKAMYKTCIMLAANKVNTVQSLYNTSRYN